MYIILFNKFLRSDKWNFDIEDKNKKCKSIYSLIYNLHRSLTYLIITQQVEFSQSKCIEKMFKV